LTLGSGGGRRLSGAVVVHLELDGRDRRVANDDRRSAEATGEGLEAGLGDQGVDEAEHRARSSSPSSLTWDRRAPRASSPRRKGRRGAAHACLLALQGPTLRSGLLAPSRGWRRRSRPCLRSPSPGR
jgi:hypothetical protein